jgi:hypothetical protein
MNDNTIFKFNSLQDSLSGKALDHAKVVLLDIMHKFKPYIRRNNLRIKIDGYRGVIKGLDGTNASIGALKYRDLPKRRAERIKSLIEELAQNPLRGINRQEWRREMSGLVIQTEGHALEDQKDVEAHGKNRMRVEVNVWLHYDDQPKSIRDE